MTKNKSTKWLPNLTLLSAFLGLLTFITLLLPAIAVKGGNTIFKGYQIAFGDKESGALAEITRFNFSFLSLLPYILGLIAIVFAVIGARGKIKFLVLLSGLLFVAQGVLFLLAVKTCSPSVIVGLLKFELAWGMIVGAVVAFLASLLSLISLLTKK